MKGMKEMRKDSQRKSKKVLTAVIAAILFLTCFMSIQTASANMFSGKTILSGNDGANGTIQKQFSVIKPGSYGSDNSESFVGNRGSLTPDSATPSYTIKTDENESVVNLCSAHYYCSLHSKVNYYPNGGVGANRTVVLICSGWHRVRDQGYYRTGYTFLGYNTMPNGTGKWYSIGQLIRLPRCTTLNLYAQWCLNQQQLLTVTYNPNGGEGQVVQDRVVPNTNYTIQDQGYFRNNYIFDGWNTQANGLGVNYSVGQVVRLTSSLTLYAKWRQTSQLLTVTYHPNSGIGDIVQDTVTANTNYTILEQGYTHSSYVFDGWNTQANGLGVNYSVGQVVRLTSSITLYAKWRGTQLYVVTYNPNGGSGSVNRDNVAVNTNYTIKDQGCTRSNYTFDGWNTQANGAGNSYAVNQVLTPLTTSLTLYAKWKATNDYSNANAAIVLMANSSAIDTNARIYYVALYSNYYLADQGFTKASYRFSHWNEKRDGTGKSYYNGNYIYMDAASKTLYAQWIK